MKLPRPIGDEPRRLELELPAVHAAVRVARQVVRSFVRMNGMPDREIDTLALVVSELLGNAIDHGGGESAMEEQDLSKSVRMGLTLVLTGPIWILHVRDQGGGDPAEIESLLRSDEPPDLEDERGRGFFLMAELVDRLEVRRTDDERGLCITARHEYDLA